MSSDRDQRLLFRPKIVTLGLHVSSIIALLRFCTSHCTYLEELRNPRPPVIDTIEATENSVTVRWLSPSEPVTGFEVTLDPVGTEVLGGGVTSFTFSNLAADTVYVLRLRALNDVGISPPTEQSIQTGECKGQKVKTNVHEWSVCCTC